MAVRELDQTLVQEIANRGINNMGKEKPTTGTKNP